MAERKYTHGLMITEHDDVTVIGIGKMEIWDGADLSLLRDSIVQLVNEDHIGQIGVDMTFVQHVPSGFFGMLFDWHERGIRVTLHSPRTRVCQMLWFRKFFLPDGDGKFVLHDGEGVNEVVDEDLWSQTDTFQRESFSLLESSR
ncbi:hypothetical protein AB1L42_13745 [Thalassoglobus sp. JC818]|uniref:hypothetical protein n=1 Tax=Thalassoglobus sp. JC818 TaxID=3232136 RepID=UPI0034598752